MHTPGHPAAASSSRIALDLHHFVAIRSTRVFAHCPHIFLNAYAGSKISAQLLCKNVTPICIRPDHLTANMPMAVTTLLLSWLIMVWYALTAKLGSAPLRPLTALGAMVGAVRLSAGGGWGSGEGNADLIVEV
ncbi:hypothetical protein PSPO01_02730 [Paraphaeosphaeria sporulosa]